MIYKPGTLLQLRSDPLYHWMLRYNENFKHKNYLFYTNGNPNYFDGNVLPEKYTMLFIKTDKDYAIDIFYCLQHKLIVSYAYTKYSLEHDWKPISLDTYQNLI